MKSYSVKSYTRNLIVFWLAISWVWVCRYSGGSENGNLATNHYHSFVLATDLCGQREFTGQQLAHQSSSSFSKPPDFGLYLQWVIATLSIPRCFWLMVFESHTSIWCQSTEHSPVCKLQSRDTYRGFHYLIAKKWWCKTRSIELSL